MTLYDKIALYRKAGHYESAMTLIDMEIRANPGYVLVLKMLRNEIAAESRQKGA
jgi:hypothetical protein